MELVLLATITLQMKQVIGKIQHRFTKGAQCQTNLITFYNTRTSSVDMGRAVDVVYQGLSKAFPTAFSSTNWQDTNWMSGL